MARRSQERPARLGAVVLVGLAFAVATPPTSAQQVEPTCDEEQQAPFPASFAGCAEAEKKIIDPGQYRTPAGFDLARYEAALADFFSRYCHRDQRRGWVRDKRVRDTGPYVTWPNDDGTWQDGQNDGTHAPVVMWYNAPMLDWLKRNRPSEGPRASEPIPLGAILVKEMYDPPAASCMRIEPERLKPNSNNGLVFMIRDPKGSRDGWFWGAWWDGFTPDWPAAAPGLPAMGYAPYCLNCHASARDNSTFADLKNIQGFPGGPNSYLSQNFIFETSLRTPLSGFTTPPPGDEDDTDHHADVRQRAVDQKGADPAAYPDTFTALYPRKAPPARASVQDFPMQRYDHVWVPGSGPDARSQFLTSDQCLGCHDAGSTGLQFDMTAQPPPGQDGNLLNLSPYGSWRSSPMGLGGRDPIFFAQLASETETFHPTHSGEIQDVCLGCHGVQGQRQHAIDQHLENGDCGEMRREWVSAVPYPPDPKAPYGALARDGIACSACHHMALTDAQIQPVLGAPQNVCVEQRQQSLNPGLTGFARTFTGSFFVGNPDELMGPFKDPRPKPMEHALGIRPVEDPAIRSSEVCGSCHTVHLPVYGADGALLARRYEQTTYPEWAFSAFRTGWLPGGAKLPSGPGKLAASCQDCHMRSKDTKGKPLASKIASIQELSNFPASENTLPAADIDLPVRPDFALHTLVGLNVFLVRMAKQFPDIFGIPSSDPMLGGMSPMELTELAMLSQAAAATATVSAKPQLAKDGLTVDVTVRSAVGHKLPSGVGFRRAFLELQVLDAQGKALWVSGRTDVNGIILGPDGKPIAGEKLWKDDCSARLQGTPHQPHYQTIRRQDQVQIYQELALSPAPVKSPKCGEDATPGGEITTSFLSICGHLKDNRILPTGFLALAQRKAIAKALGADPNLAEETGPVAVGNDPDYRDGGLDSLRYEIALPKGTVAASVQATLYYQAIPPFYLQDRICTAKGPDVDRLYFLAGHLDAKQPSPDTWKLSIASSGPVAVGR